MLRSDGLVSGWTHAGIRERRRAVFRGNHRPCNQAPHRAVVSIAPDDKRYATVARRPLGFASYAQQPHNQKDLRRAVSGWNDCRRGLLDSDYRWLRHGSRNQLVSQRQRALLSVGKGWTSLYMGATARSAIKAPG